MGRQAAGVGRVHGETARIVMVEGNAIRGWLLRLTPSTEPGLEILSLAASGESMAHLCERGADQCCAYGNRASVVRAPGGASDRGRTAASGRRYAVYPA